MSYMFSFVDRRHGIENFFPEESHAFIFVDGEISDTETCKVLEEVSTLTWVHAIVLESYFHYYLCSTYVWPFHGDAEPRVA